MIEVSVIYPAESRWKIEFSKNCAILIDAIDQDYFFSKIIESKKNVSVSMMNYTFVENETIARNLSFLQVNMKNIKESFPLDFQRKVSTLSAFEKTILRLFIGSKGKNALYVQNPFTEDMSPYHKLKIIEKIQSLQEQSNCLILSVITDPKDGVFFQQLAVFQRITDTFLPLK